MHPIKKIIFFLSMLFSGLVISQNETVNWYFGDNAGLYFNYNTMRTTVLNNGSMSTPAGCSSISDKNGNLLFYTNGLTFWNKNHEVMENGNNNAADITNSQSCLIIPKPNDDNTYFIFLTRGVKSTTPLLTSGLFYAQVEFANNPLGEVTVKNSRLLSTTTERITAIHHIESNSIKVITFGSELDDNKSPKDTFFVFNVDVNGLHRTPEKSIVEALDSSKGAMKISPDGKKIAIADFGGNSISLYDFNNSTITFDQIINPNIPFTLLNPYGIEFSQDSKILYFTANSNSSSFLYKFEFYSRDVLIEKKLVGSSSNYFYGDLQLAIDGKIYVANYIENNSIQPINNIGVINFPENADTDSGYSPLAVNLNPNASFKGLPIFISSFFRNRIITENKCVEDTFQFSTDSYMPIDSIFWEFGDNTTSTDINPNHQYNISGSYLVTATITYNNIDYPIKKVIQVYAKPIINSTETLLQCDTENNGTSLFNLHNIKDHVINYNRDYEYFFYRNQSDALGNINQIQNSKNYTNTNFREELFVKIVSPEGCSTISNFFIETTKSDLVELEAIYTCENTDGIYNNRKGLFDLNLKEIEIRTQLNIPLTSKISFYKTLQEAQTKLNELSIVHDSSSTKLWIRIETLNNDCAGIGYFDAIVNSGIEPNIDDSYTICYSNEDSKINLDGGENMDVWQWKNTNGEIISTNRNISISNPGNYSLTVSKTENNLTCTSTKKFLIKSPHAVTFGELKTENNQISISVIGFSSYQFSIDGIHYFGNKSDYTFENVNAGIHTVYVKDVNSCEAPISQNVAFIGYPRYFTPNNDGVNDLWKIEGISDEFYNSADIYIYDRYGKSLHYMNLNTNQYGWNGSFNGKQLTSNDYWFKVTLINNENKTLIKTGHFTIKH